MVRLLPLLALAAFVLAPLASKAQAPDDQNGQAQNGQTQNQFNTQDQQRPGQAFLGIRPEQPSGQNQQAGVVIGDVQPNSPADRAGLKPGDQIVKVGNHNVNNFDALARFLSREKPGQKVNVSVMRDGQEKQLTVTLGTRPQDGMEEGMGQGNGQEGTGEEPAENPRSSGERTGRGQGPAFLGVEVVPQAEQGNQQGSGAGNAQGVTVAQVVPGTPAQKAGIRTGDVITKVNDQTITSAPQLRNAVRRAGVGKDIAITVQRDGNTKTLHVRLEAAPQGEFGGGGESGMGPGGMGNGMGAGGMGMGPGAMGPGGMRQMSPTMQQMQHRIDQLERRVHELEQKLETQGQNQGQRPPK